VSPATAISAEELLEELRERQGQFNALIVGANSSGKVRDHNGKKASN
jgi:glutamyl-tRNA synthetase